MDELAEGGTVSIRLLGGEPLLVNKLNQLIAHIKSKGMYCEIVTNGMLIRKRVKEWPELRMVDSLSRGIFFCFTSDLFPMIYEDGWLQVFLHGIRFDLSAFAYFNIIFILLLVLPTRLREKKAYQKILQGLFVFFNGLVLFLNLADVVNVEFTGKRMTADIFTFLSQVLTCNACLDFIKDYWFIPLIWLLMLVGMRQTLPFFKEGNSSYIDLKSIGLVLWFHFGLGLTVLMRGGTQLRLIKNICRTTVKADMP